MKKTILFVAAVAALASCTQKTEVAAPSLEREVSIVATSAQTKTQLSGDAVLWEANDAVSLMFKKSAVPFVTSFTTTAAGANATFTGTLPNTVSVAGGYGETGYAVYPATAMSNEGTVSFTLPSAVTVNANGSFDSGKNLSSAKVSLADLDAEGTTEAHFLNAFSIIRFTLDAGVETLTLTADEALVGTAAMVFDSNGRLVKSGDFTSPSNTITVTPPSEGTFDGTTSYNVLVFPGTFTSLTARMTDADGCTFEKTNTGTYEFAAAKYYTFNFTNPANFNKDYAFTALGRTFAEGTDQVQVVIGSTPEGVLTAKADNKFAGKTTHAKYEANAAGYLLYPASAYNAGNISYTLPADGTQPTAQLWSAPFSLQSTEAAFTSVMGAFAKISFTVPAGVKSISIASDKGLVGATSMSVVGGNLVADTAAGNEITIANATGTYALYVCPVTAAALTVTLTDAASKTVTKNYTLTVAAGATQTIDLSGDLNFDKNGNFTNEEYTSGGDAVEF